MSLERSEIFSYFMLISGVIVDNNSTKIGISRHSLLESNILSKTLMDFGVWGYTDFFICILLILITYHTYHNILGKESKLVIIFPFIAGLFRLFIGVLNVTLF